MRLKRQTNNKRGVAIFFALFVMIILGILITQFYLSSRNAQSTVHRFQTSEMARQLAAAAQEEAFKYLYDNTDNYESKGFDDLDVNSILRTIIEGESSKVYVPDFNRNDSNGIKLKIPETEKMAEDLLSNLMELSATARIIDFRNYDPDNYEFYGKEGIGTIEIVTTAKAKDKYKKQFPGACTIIRHHDFKVVSLLSKSNRDNYAGSWVLDYALFIRKGQEEFGGNTQYLGFNINPPDNIQLEINAGNGSTLGKVHFGTDYEHYTYLNISDKTKDFIPNGNKVIPLDSLTAEDSDVNLFFPSFAREVKAKAIALGTDEIHKKGAKVESINASVRGHKAIFQYIKLPITDDHIKTDDLKKIRQMSAVNALSLYKYVTDNKFNFYDGIKIKPKERLDEILDSDIRKQYLNYAYFKLDLSNCIVRVWGSAKKHHQSKSFDESKPLSQAEKELSKGHEDEIVCFNNKYFAAKNLEEVKNTQKDYNYEELYKFIMQHDDNQQPSIASRAFTFINNEYSYQLKNASPTISYDNFYYSNYTDKGMPCNSQYPFAHFNLFNKRYINNDKSDELEELGIYDKKNHILNLRGIVQCSKLLELGDENSTLTIKGSGVLIARGITIKGQIKKDKQSSVAVLFARNGDIRIKTSKTIEAALIAMKGPDGDGVNQGAEGRIIADETMNLKGSLAVDNLNTIQWKKSVTHKITYDENLAPTKDVYQVNIANWVTFERVIEHE